MNTKYLKTILSAVGLASASLLLLTACGGGAAEPVTDEISPPADNAENATSPADALLLAEAPADVRPIGEVLVEPAVGDRVTVAGQIGGTTEPFGDGYALFLMADESVMFCDEMAEEHCPTPWDACCEDLDKLRANRALVQFVDAEGEVLPIDLQASAGLAGLDRVIIQGTIAQVSPDGAVIINATGLYRGRS